MPTPLFKCRASCQNEVLIKNAPAKEKYREISGSFKNWVSKEIEEWFLIG